MERHDRASDVVVLSERDGSRIGRIVVDGERIERRVRELGAEITRDYSGRSPIFVGVLKGAFLFMSDLAKQVELPLRFDFMAVSSYGSATKTSGVVRIMKDLDHEIADEDVIVIDDIIDSGLTLNYLLRYLRARGPASVEVCALFSKEGRQRVEIPVRYRGFRIGPEFVVGYGLDFEERYRNLPYLAVLADGDVEPQRR